MHQRIGSVGLRYGFVLIGLAISLGCGGSPPVQSCLTSDHPRPALPELEPAELALDPTSEPALPEGPRNQLVLEIDGRHYRVTEGETFELPGCGHQVNIRLASTQEIRANRLHFHVPQGCSVEVEETPEGDTWHIENADGFVMITTVPGGAGADQAQFVRAVMNAMQSRMRNAEMTELQPKTITVAGQRVEFLRLRVTLLQESFEQLIGTFAIGEDLYAIVFQDSGDEPGETPGFRDFVELFERTSVAR